MNKGRYKDQEKYKDMKAKQRQRYYQRSSDAPNSRSKWSDFEIDAILNSDKSDSELAKELGRSIKSIQCKRMREMANRKGENVK